VDFRKGKRGNGFARKAALESKRLVEAPPYAAKPDATAGARHVAVKGHSGDYFRSGLEKMGALPDDGRRLISDSGAKTGSAWNPGHRTKGFSF
jgi:hypothetical protein